MGKKKRWNEATRPHRTSYYKGWVSAKRKKYSAVILSISPFKSKVDFEKRSGHLTCRSHLRLPLHSMGRKNGDGGDAAIPGNNAGRAYYARDPAGDCVSTKDVPTVKLSTPFSSSQSRYFIIKLEAIIAERWATMERRERSRTQRSDGRIIWLERSFDLLGT